MYQFITLSNETMSLKLFSFTRWTFIQLSSWYCNHSCSRVSQISFPYLMMSFRALSLYQTSFCICYRINAYDSKSAEIHSWRSRSNYERSSMVVIKPCPIKPAPDINVSINRIHVNFIETMKSVCFFFVFNTILRHYMT